MNIRALITTLAVALPLCAMAAPPERTDVIVDCRHGARPTLPQVARYTGAATFSDDARRTRLWMLEQIHQACRRGQEQVHLVFLSEEASDRRQASVEKPEDAP